MALIMLTCGPAMRNVAGLAVFRGAVDRLEHQHLAGMATQTVIVVRLDSLVGLMAFVAVEPCHRHLVRE